MICAGCGSPSSSFHVTDKDNSLELHYCIVCVVPFTVGTPYEKAGREFREQHSAVEAWVKDHEEFMRRVSPRAVAAAAFLAGRKFERELRGDLPPGFTV